MLERPPPVAAKWGGGRRDEPAVARTGELGMERRFVILLSALDEGDAVVTGAWGDAKGGGAIYSTALDWVKELFALTHPDSPCGRIDSVRSLQGLQI